MSYRGFGCLFVLCVLAVAARAQAAGFDTPILYSARHMGMGGTAIGYVNDPSAAFHNPAGLGQVRGLSLLGDLSLLAGRITASPGNGLGDLPDADGNYPSRTSQLIVAPAFLIGGGYRLSEYLSVGVAAFPVASATGEYRGESLTGNPTVDRTKLLFLETTPVLALSLPQGVRIGLGYRITLSELERVQGDRDNPQSFDFTASGVDYAGFRVGAQWTINPRFSVGAVYRHKIEPKLTADSGVAYADVVDLKTRFVLPSKLGLGGRADFGALGIALDLEYGFYSQNDRTRLQGCNPSQPPQSGRPSCSVNGQARKLEYADNVFDWKDAPTVRIGAEYKLTDNWPVRVGYVFDGQASSQNYPSAFGTPPAASHSGTVGAGYRGERFQVNVAGALRLASTEVTPSDVEGKDCATCSKAGKDYSLWLSGAYVDFSYDFDVAPLF